MLSTAGTFISWDTRWECKPSRIFKPTVLPINLRCISFRNYAYFCFVFDKHTIMTLLYFITSVTSSVVDVYIYPSTVLYFSWLERGRTERYNKGSKQRADKSQNYWRRSNGFLYSPQFPHLYSLRMIKLYCSVYQNADL